MEKNYSFLTERPFAHRGYHSWSLNPYSKGDWAYRGPGQIKEFGQEISKPHFKLHFCGEHTAIANRGMEGALESGERAFFEILDVT